MEIYIGTVPGENRHVDTAKGEIARSHEQSLPRAEECIPNAREVQIHGICETVVGDIVGRRQRGVDRERLSDRNGRGRFAHIVQGGRETRT